MATLRTQFWFEYQAPGRSKPEQLTLAAVPTETNSGAPIPHVGDEVVLKLCHPESVRGNHKRFKVINRLYEYAQIEKNDGAIGAITHCDVTVVVTDV